MTRVYPHMLRALADSRDRPAWLAAREFAIGGSDAASFSKLESAPRYLAAKLGTDFRGNSFTAHGNDRERHILAAYGIEQNFTLFHAAETKRHVATPDGIKLGGDGSIILCQVKTTDHPFKTVPRSYYRQVWWEQYVLGAERTLFAWEHHTGFTPENMDPDSILIDRDDDEIAKMIEIADFVTRGMDEHARFKREMETR